MRFWPLKKFIRGFFCGLWADFRTFIFFLLADPRMSVSVKQKKAKRNPLFPQKWFKSPSLSCHLRFPEWTPTTFQTGYLYRLKIRMMVGWVPTPWFLEGLRQENPQCWPTSSMGLRHSWIQSLPEISIHFITFCTSKDQIPFTRVRRSLRSHHGITSWLISWLISW